MSQKTYIWECRVGTSDPKYFFKKFNAMKLIIGYFEAPKAALITIGSATKGINFIVEPHLDLSIGPRKTAHLKKHPILDYHL